MSEERKIFNYDNQNKSKVVSNLKSKELYDNSISACGSLFYKIIDGDVYLLLIKYDDPGWNKLDDFGGRIDVDDDSITCAITREVCEETNKQISREDMKECIQDGILKTFYNKFSKYYFHLIEAGDDFFEDTSVFGTFEEADKIKRTIDWYKYIDVKNDLAYRLSKTTEFIAFLDSL
jgi:hypothetical protein